MWASDVLVRPREGDVGGKGVVCCSIVTQRLDCMWKNQLMIRLWAAAVR